MRKAFMFVLAALLGAQAVYADPLDINIDEIPESIDLDFESRWGLCLIYIEGSGYVITDCIDEDSEPPECDDGGGGIGGGDGGIGGGIGGGCGGGIGGLGDPCKAMEDAWAGVSDETRDDFCDATCIDNGADGGSWGSFVETGDGCSVECICTYAIDPDPEEDEGLGSGGGGGLNP